MEEEALGDQLPLRPLVSHPCFPSVSQAKASGVAIPEHQWDSVMESGLILPIAVSEFRLGFYLVYMFSHFYILGLLLFSLVMGLYF